MFVNTFIAPDSSNLCKIRLTGISLIAIKTNFLAVVKIYLLFLLLDRILYSLFCVHQTNYWILNP